MKNVLLPLTTICLLFILFTGCQKDPVFTVTFDMSAEMVNVGQDIIFTSTSSDNVTEFLWDFGDGNTSKLENPSHMFNAEGLYSVTLTGTVEDLSSSTSKDVTIADVQPTASFNLPDLLQTKCPIIFQNTSIMAAEYSWDFGDGNTSTLQSPTHTYTTAGTYNITLITKNGTKDAEEDKSVIINSGTGIEIIPETQNTEARDVVALSDGYLIGTSVDSKSKIYKKDNLGNTVWAKIYGGNDNYEFEKMTKLQNGNFAIGASYSGASGNNLGYIIFDSNGTEISKNFNSLGGSQYVNGILSLSNGTFVVYGRDFFGGNNSGYMIGVDENSGEVLWTKLYEEPFEDFINSAVDNSDDSFILGGSRNDAGSGANPKSLLLKYSYTGDLVWDKTGDILSQPTIKKLVRLNNQGIYIIGDNAITIINNEGQPSTTKNFSPGATLLIRNAITANNKILALGNTTGNNPYAIQFNSEAEVEWQETLENTQDWAFLLGAVKYNECNYLLIGSTIDLQASLINPIIYRTTLDGKL